MFWRILGQLFSASRGRLAVALIALASGAAVTTALINLNLDADRKLSTEFRTLGTNVVILPNRSAANSVEADETRLTSEFRPQHFAGRNSAIFHWSPESSADDPLSSPTVFEDVMDRLAAIQGLDNSRTAPYLYVVANHLSGEESSITRQPMILVGTWLDRAHRCFRAPVENHWARQYQFPNRSDAEPIVWSVAV